jgi:hypothetical protein
MTGEEFKANDPGGEYYHPSSSDIEVSVLFRGGSYFGKVCLYQPMA